MALAQILSFQNDSEIELLPSMKIKAYMSTERTLLSPGPINTTITHPLSPPFLDKIFYEKSALKLNGDRYTQILITVYIKPKGSH